MKDYSHVPSGSRLMVFAKRMSASDVSLHFHFYLLRKRQAPAQRATGARQGDEPDRKKPATRLASGTRVRVVIARLVMRAIQTG